MYTQDRDLAKIEKVRLLLPLLRSGKLIEPRAAATSLARRRNGAGPKRSRSPGAPPAGSEPRGEGRWTDLECQRFEEMAKQRLESGGHGSGGTAGGPPYLGGDDWAAIAAHIGTRDASQVRSYAKRRRKGPDNGADSGPESAPPLAAAAQQPSSALAAAAADINRMAIEASQSGGGGGGTKRDHSGAMKVPTANYSQSMSTAAAAAAAAVAVAAAGADAADSERDSSSDSYSDEEGQLLVQPPPQLPQPPQEEGKAAAAAVDTTADAKDILHV